MSIPSNLIPVTILRLPEDPNPSDLGWMMYVNNGNTYKVQVNSILNVSGVPTSRAVIAGTGLIGGGTLATDITISVAPGGIGATQLDTTGVTAGTYGDVTNYAVVTVDLNGRITSAAELPLPDVSSYVPSNRQIIAGAGLLGGGALTSDVTISVNLSNLTPLALGTETSGVSNEVSRADHVHPALNLTDTTQTTGVLDPTRGGTGTALIAPSAGGVAYSDGSNILVSDAGSPGQVLTSSGAGEPVWSAAGSGDVVGPASATDNALVRFDGTTGGLIQNAPVTLDDNGNFEFVNAVSFDLTPSTPPTAPGSLYWDSADGNQTLSLVMANGVAIQQIGEETYYRIKASAPITNGQLVMFTGAVGASGALTGAPASGLTAETAFYIMGIATHTLATNEWGYITHFGIVRQINTTGAAVGETWADGDVLYYNPAVAGGLTKTVPTAPNAKVQVCAVTRAASNGSVFVRPTFGGTLGQYEGDVNITTPANGQLLIRNQTAGRWENATLTAGSGITVTNAAGAVTISAAGGTVTDVSVVSANGFAGSVATSTTTPAITLTTSITGMIKGNGTALSAAVAGTDYLAPAAIGVTVQAYDAQLANIAGLTPTNDGVIIGNGTNFVLESGATLRTSLGLGSLATLSSINNSNWSGTDLSVANGGTGVSTLTGIVKGNGTSAFSAAVAGTDYLSPAAIGVTVLAYDSNLQGFVTTFTLPTVDSTAGYVLSTNGAGTLSWVVNGSGGSMVYPGAGIAVSTGTVWGTSLTAPTGTIVGTSDNQTLTTKTISLTNNTVTGTKTQFNTACSDGDFVYTDAIGVSVQAYSANLDEYAAVNPTAAGLALLDDIDAAAQRTTLGLGTLATQNGTFSGTSSGTNTGDQNLFSTIAVAGQSNVVADATSDTLTLVAGTNVSITTDAATDTITIAATSGGGTVGFEQTFLLMGA